MAAPSIAEPPLPLLHPDIIPRSPSSPPKASGPPRATPQAAPDDASQDDGSDPNTTPLPCACRGDQCPGASTTSDRTTQQGTPPPVASSAAAAEGEEWGRPLDSREVAACMFLRIWDAEPRKEGRPALRCVCMELPDGSPCALHQDAPGLSWIKRRGGIPLVGGVAKVVVPSVRAGDGTQMFAEYVRWRRSVWLPSRFYMEHVRGINAVGRKYGSSRGRRDAPNLSC